MKVEKKLENDWFINKKKSNNIMGPFGSLKIIFEKIFFVFLGVCFTKNKWSTENIFMVN